MDDVTVDHEVSDVGYSAWVSARSSVSCIGRSTVMVTYSYGYILALALM